MLRDGKRSLTVGGRDVSLLADYHLLRLVIFYSFVVNCIFSTYSVVCRLRYVQMLFNMSRSPMHAKAKAQLGVQSQRQTVLALQLEASIGAAYCKLNVMLQLYSLMPWAQDTQLWQWSPEREGLSEVVVNTAE